MAVENITLNLIPTGDTPSIHVAQFDVDRQFTVTLKEGEDDFTPTGYDIELQVRKVDNNIVTAATSSVTGNVVTFNTTEQMTACSGTNIAELQLTKDSQTFATLHFYLVVQRDVLAGGVSSASDIYNLTEQIADIVPEVIGDDYYNKEEVDEKIAEIPTFDPTNYYDKSETDALLDDKADVSDLPDMSNYYDKSETDALLDDKADVSDLPDMTNYYTKSEVDTKITDLYQIKTASGSIVHITDGGNDIPVKSLVSQIVAVETGSGEKSPENPYTISGFANGIITRCDNNLIDDSKYYQAGANTVVIGQTLPNSNRTIFLPKGTYTIKVNTNVTAGIYYNFGNGSTLIGNTPDARSFTLANDSWCAFSIYKSGGFTPSDYTSIQLEVGDSATTYEPYTSNTYTFTFGQTVYGGHFDNKGNLVVTHGFDLNTGDISEGWFDASTGGIIRFAKIKSDMQSSASRLELPCNIASFSTGNENNIIFGVTIGGSNLIYYYPPDTVTDLASLYTFLSNNNLQVVYPLANPITLTITSQDIPTLLGENNIFSNCGDVEVKYFTEKSDGIAELIKAFI